MTGERNTGVEKWVAWWPWLPASLNAAYTGDATDLKGNVIRLPLRPHFQRGSELTVISIQETFVVAVDLKG